MLTRLLCLVVAESGAPVVIGGDRMAAFARASTNRCVVCSENFSAGACACAALLLPPLGNRGTDLIILGRLLVQSLSWAFVLCWFNLLRFGCVVCLGFEYTPALVSSSHEPRLPLLDLAVTHPDTSSYNSSMTP